MTPRPWLVVVDMQVAFGRPPSEWAVPRYAQIEPVVAQLMDDFAGRVVVTRFVPDGDEHGAWKAYYDRWSSFRLPADASDWDVTLPYPDGTPVVSLPTFSKWGPELAEITGADTPLVVCGVATDCCVLSTVLGAVDAGHHVTVVSDACDGVTSTHHDNTLALLELLAPMVHVTTAAALAPAG